MSLRILVTVEEADLFDRCRECGFDARLERPGKLALARLRKEFPDLVLASPAEIERLNTGDLPHAPAFIACVPNERPELGLQALQAGASDVLLLPASASELKQSVFRASRLRAIEGERDALRAPVAREARAHLAGDSREAIRLNDSVLRVAATPGTTVLVRTEQHGGASAIARAIHLEGRHARAPFVEVECGEEPSALELEDPSFFSTLYSAARSGTLHLDEVGQLGRAGQARLLEVLEGRSSDLGSPSASAEAWTVPDQQSVRIVASTSKDLDQLCDEGQFAEDLLYRLNVLVVSAPPLRERKEDLYGLARALYSHLIKIPAAGAFAQLGDKELEDNFLSLRRFVFGVEARPETQAPGAFGLALPADDYSVRSAERALIELVLERTGGNRSEAARLLEVNRTTLYNKLRTYRL